jgi:hypothetical protein
VRRFQLMVIGGWLTAVAIFMGMALSFGPPPTVANQGFALLVAFVPPFLWLALVPMSAPTRSVTQILYDQEHPARRDGRVD